MSVRAEAQIDLARVDDGTPGQNGATFTPSVDAAGDISWTNDGGLPNPATQNIMGPPGSSGPTITDVKTQYYLSTSSSSATGGSWSDTPQAFVSGKYYWTREYTTYSDGTHTTSTPVYNQGLTLANEYALSASNAADNASEYAARAYANLATVQSIAETLTWIAQHGTMTLTSDVTLDPTHVYFVVDAGGDYVVNGITYAIVTEPDVADIGTYYELSIDESLNNYVGTHLALDTEGLWLLPASSGTNKVLIATGAGSTYTTAGTYIVDSGGSTVASFRSNGATIGEITNGNSRTEIGTAGMQIYQRDGGNDVQIANLGYGPGTDSGGGTSDAPYYTLGERLSASQIGNYSVGEGQNIIASGYNSHAEGIRTTASGQNSHAENYYTTASGPNSHAEGGDTTASGQSAHAENYYTTASGFASHAGGDSTIAQRSSQAAIGKYNIADTQGADGFALGEYAFIIGNGTADNARSNAFTVDWSGDVFLALDTTAASGTDHDLYAAINALNWASDVVV